MAQQLLVWTVLPHGRIREGEFEGLYRVSIVVSPRLTPEAADEQTLAAFPDWLNWPDFAEPRETGAEDRLERDRPDTDLEARHRPLEAALRRQDAGRGVRLQEHEHSQPALVSGAERAGLCAEELRAARRPVGLDPSDTAAMGPGPSRSADHASGHRNPDHEDQSRRPADRGDASRLLALLRG